MSNSKYQKTTENSVVIYSGSKQYKNPIKNCSVSEVMFKEALYNLSDKWNRLSKKDEEIIIKISNKF